MGNRIALVTGATGFIGSHAAAALADAGYHVRCAMRPGGRTGWLDALDFERVEMDVTRPTTLDRALDGAEVVVHGAGVTSARDEDLFDRVNVGGTRSVVRAAREAGAKRVVLLSSLAARGPDERAGDGGDRPVSAYGESKLAAERVLREEADGALEHVSLRLAAVYGPRDRDMLPLFAMARRGVLTVPGASHLRLQPLFVGDAADAVVAAAKSRAGSGPFDVAGAGRYGWIELATQMGRVLHRRVVPIRLPPEAFTLGGRVSERVAGWTGREAAFDLRRARDLARHTWTCDLGPAQHGLGWNPSVSLAEGLTRTAHWYEAQGWL